MFIDTTERVRLEQEPTRLQVQNACLQEEIKSLHDFEEIVGSSTGLLDVLETPKSRRPQSLGIFWTMNNDIQDSSNA